MLMPKAKSKSKPVSPNTSTPLDPQPDTELVLHGEEQDLQYLQGLMPVLGDFVWLAQLATNGDPEKLAHFVDNPASFSRNLLFDDRSRLLDYMKVRALRGYLQSPSKKDPLEHGKFLVELIKLEKELGKEPLSPGRSADEGASPASRKLLSLLEESDEAD